MAHSFLVVTGVDGVGLAYPSIRSTTPSKDMMSVDILGNTGMNSFSTMWAQQDRFADLEVFREAVAAMGYDAIEVSHSTAEGGLEQLLKPGPIPVSSLHAPTPRLKLRDGRVNGDANLATPNAAKRKEAVQHHLRTLEYAAANGLTKVVVHLGGVGDTMMAAERELRRLVESGRGDSEDAEAYREQCRTKRKLGIDACLAAARKSLKELASYASAHGIAMASRAGCTITRSPPGRGGVSPGAIPPTTSPAGRPL